LAISQPPPRITVEDYLAFERAAEERHEYFDGEIAAMVGETLQHAIISTNVLGSLGMQLKSTPCFAVTKDIKVRSGLGIASARSTRGMFSYPDILVICGKPEFFDDHQDVVMNPTTIVEVLSKSTESFDRGEKFQRYRAWNPTLQDYLLVSQTRPFVEQFRCQPDSIWTMQESLGLGSTAVLPSIACTLKLADVYDRIDFPREHAEPGT
jgi:Uma2 family endonuclease